MAKNSTAAQWAKKGFAQVNGGNLVDITKKVGGRKTATVKKLPVLIPGDMPKVSKTVMNATKVEINGIKFASKLEAYLYSALTAAGIEFEYQKVYELQPKFKYLGETIRPIKIIVDFYLTGRNKIVDSKGWSTTISTLKYKLLKYLFFKHNDEPEIYMPGTPAEVNFLINKLRYDK